jgi:hypothetical protein
MSFLDAKKKKRKAPADAPPKKVVRNMVIHDETEIVAKPNKARPLTPPPKEDGEPDPERGMFPLRVFDLFAALCLLCLFVFLCDFCSLVCVDLLLP